MDMCFCFTITQFDTIDVFVCHLELNGKPQSAGPSEQNGIGQDSPGRHRCEPTHHHRGQAVQDGRQKDVRRETICEGLEGTSWCLNENGVHTPVHRRSRRAVGESLTFPG